MVGSVGDSSGATGALYQRKVLPPASTKGVGGSVYKPRLVGFASPEMMETIKQMSAGAKNAQAHYDAMAKQAAEMMGAPSPQLIAARQYFGLDQFGKPLGSGSPLSAVVLDTKA